MLDLIFHWDEHLEAVVGALLFNPFADLERKIKKYVLLGGSLAVVALALYLFCRTRPLPERK